MRDVANYTLCTTAFSRLHFPGEAKGAYVLMRFRAPPAALEDDFVGGPRIQGVDALSH